MIEALGVFANHVLTFRGLKATNLPRKIIPDLLTAFSDLIEDTMVILEPVFEMDSAFGSRRFSH
jgi:hypothetical protein